MDPVLGIIAGIPVTGVTANRALNPNAGLLAFNPGLVTSGAFGELSTVVQLSGVGQLLSAAASFQDQLGALHPGAAESGGGRGFGLNLASLAAQAQSFANAFNGLQNSLAHIETTGALLGAIVPGSDALAQVLDGQAQASFVNGGSTLTRLAQIGIAFQPAQAFGASSTLSIDLEALTAAFDSDAAGAFSLLSKAVDAFGAVAENFVGAGGGQFSTLIAQVQSAALDQIFGNSLLSSAAGTGTFNLASALALGPLTQGVGVNTRQAILAANEFALVSALLG